MTHQNIFKFQGNPAAGLPWDLEKIGGLGGLVWNIEIFSGLPWNIEKFSGLPWVRWVNLELRKKTRVTQQVGYPDGQGKCPRPVQIH